VYVCIHICLYALLHAWMHNLPSACVGVCVQQGAYAAVVPVRNLTYAPPHTIWSISDTLSISASAWTDVGYSLHVSLKWGLGMTWTSLHTIPSIGDMWSPLDLLVINQLDVRSWLHNLVYQRRALLFVVVRGHIAAWQNCLELRMCHVSLMCHPTSQDRGSLLECLYCIADILDLDPLATDSTINAEHFWDSEDGVDVRPLYLLIF